MYFPETGEFYWTQHAYCRMRGKRAGTTILKGYRIIQIEQERYLEHRLAWLLMTGDWPADELDHRDRNRAHNVWSNIRPATHKQNMENVPRRKDNLSGVRGVYRRPYQKWGAFITHDGIQVHLGTFSTFDAAVAARLAAERGIYTHSEVADGRGP